MRKSIIVQVFRKIHSEWIWNRLNKYIDKIRMVEKVQLNLSKMRFSILSSFICRLFSFGQLLILPLEARGFLLNFENCLGYFSLIFRFPNNMVLLMLYNCVDTKHIKRYLANMFFGFCLPLVFFSMSYRFFFYICCNTYIVVV